MTESHTPRMSDYTVSTGIEGFLRSKRRKLLDSSYQEYERVCGRILETLGPDTFVEDLEPPHGTEILEEMMDDLWGRTPHAYNRNLSIVRGLTKYLLERGRLQRDPCLPLERARPEKKQHVYFSEDDIKTILAAAPSTRDRVCLNLMLVYGLRKGGILNLTYSCFDKQRKVVIFKTKGAKYHTIPLEGKIWDDIDVLLDSHSQDEAVLNRTNDPFTPLSPHAAHDWWYARLADAGIVPEGTTAGTRMHMARHTAGQRVLNATGNLKAAQALLGHESIQTTASSYVSWDTDALRETMQGITE